MTEMGLGWLGLALFFLILSVFSWLWSRRKRVELGLPQGKILYSDLGVWVPLQESLYSPECGLVGRPDYLVRDRGGFVIPVEVKTALAPDKPHDGDVMQLATYCLLVETVYGVRPEYGILQYRDRAYAVEYSIELEEDLLDLLTKMREDMFKGELNRNHGSWGRCSGCSLREHCLQRLA